MRGQQKIRVNSWYQECRVGRIGGSWARIWRKHGFYLVARVGYRESRLAASVTYTLGNHYQRVLSVPLPFGADLDEARMVVDEFVAARMGCKIPPSDAANPVKV